MDWMDHLVARNRDLLARATELRLQFDDIDARVESEIAQCKERRDAWQRKRQQMKDRRNRLRP